MTTVEYLETLVKFFENGNYLNYSVVSKHDSKVLFLSRKRYSNAQSFCDSGEINLTDPVYGMASRISTGNLAFFEKPYGHCRNSLLPFIYARFK